MHRKRRVLIMLSTIISIFLLGACAGTNSNKDGNSERNNALSQIKERDIIKVGIEGAYPPFNYFNEKNELIGFDVDITNEIASRMGVEVEFIPTPWDTIIGGLNSNKFDIILSSMAITEERKNKVDFTEAYYHTGAQLFSLKSNKDIKDPQSDIKGRNIGVATGTTFTEKAEELGATPQFYKSDLLAFQDLANGRIDGVITDKAVGSRLIVEHDYPAHAVGKVLYSEVAGITLRKNQTDLLNELNKNITEITEDGTYEKISLKWFGENIR